KLSYNKGNVTSPLTVAGKANSTYTKIKYSLDDEVYEENYFTIEELCQVANEQASLINGNIVVVDEQSGEEYPFHYDNGIVEFLESRTEGLSKLHEVISFNKTLSF